MILGRTIRNWSESERVGGRLKGLVVKSPCLRYYRCNTNKGFRLNHTHTIPTALNGDCVAAQNGLFRPSRWKMWIWMRSEKITVGISSRKIIIHTSWMKTGSAADMIVGSWSLRASRCVTAIPGAQERNRIFYLHRS